MTKPEAFRTLRSGTISAFTAYGIWGVLPLFWKQFGHLSSFVVLAHRSFWAFILTLILSMLFTPLRKQLSALFNLRNLVLTSISSVLVGCNWFLYIWAVNSNHIIETSLGYYMNPLISVWIGTCFFKESLRPAQWFAILTALTGVILMLIFYGELPWISLGLALSFACYGMIKKMTPVTSFAGLLAESFALSLVIIPILFWSDMSYSGLNWMKLSASDQFLLICSGLFTASPLFLFSQAAKCLPLSILGFMQYIAPTLQLAVGVMVFKEEFTQSLWLAFGFIWLALIIYSIEGIFVVKKRTSIPAAR